MFSLLFMHLIIFLLKFKYCISYNGRSWFYMSGLLSSEKYSILHSHFLCFYVLESMRRCLEVFISSFLHQDQMILLHFPLTFQAHFLIYLIQSTLFLWLAESTFGCLPSAWWVLYYQIYMSLMVEFHSSKACFKLSLRRWRTEWQRSTWKNVQHP